MGMHFSKEPSPQAGLSPSVWATGTGPHVWVAAYLCSELGSVDDQRTMMRALDASASGRTGGFEEQGNAFTIEVKPRSVTIEFDVDDAVEPTVLSPNAMREALLAWHRFCVSGEDEEDWTPRGPSI